MPHWATTRETKIPIPNVTKYASYIGWNLTQSHCYNKPENTHLLHKGKYHCSADLLFDPLGFGQTSKSVYSFNSKNSWIQTSQTGGQPYIDISPYKLVSVLWLSIKMGTSLENAPHWNFNFLG